MEIELEHGKGVALWRQIQKAIEQDILDGAIAPGGKLPPERILAEQFRVNRHTLRQALAALARKELIRAEQGRGYFVREDMVGYTLARRVRFSENLTRQCREPGGALLGGDIVEADRRATKALQVMPGAKLVRMRTVGTADEQCLCATTHFFPHSRFPTMIAEYQQTRSITAAFRELGISDYVRAQTRITARMPTASEARLLDQSRNKPVMLVESVNVDRDGVPIEYGQCIWSADRVQFVIDERAQHTDTPA